MLPGAYRLQGWATGAPVPILRRLTVAAGQEVKGLRLTPPRPATLKGVLRGEGLREGGRVQVVAVAAEVDDAGGRDDGVGADGRFELTNLARARIGSSSGRSPPPARNDRSASPTSSSRSTKA